METQERRYWASLLEIFVEVFDSRLGDFSNWTRALGDETKLSPEGRCLREVLRWAFGGVSKPDDLLPETTDGVKIVLELARDCNGLTPESSHILTLFIYELSFPEPSSPASSGEVWLPGPVDMKWEELVCWSLDK